jgi:hypothetical protein
MKTLKATPLILGVLLYANAAYGMEPMTIVGVTAAIGAGLEALGQGVAQINSSANWATSQNLTTEQTKQVQDAINYLNQKGFKEEAKQAQTLLDNSRSWTRSTLVYREGKGNDMALTSGGPVNAVFNNGHITLYRNFFDVAKHDGIAIDAPDKRTRDQAQVLLHELEHLNTQANTHHIYLISPTWDWEKGPITKQVESLGTLGYTPDEVRTIRGTWDKGPYKKYVNLIDKELPKLDPPKADEATPPATNDAGTTEPGPDTKSDRPRKQKSDATKSKGPRTIDDEPTKTKAPPREKSDSGDQSDVPGPTPDQIARASKLGDQAQGGIPGTSQPTGARTGQSGQPQGGYQGGQEVPGAPGPQQPGQQPGFFPPYDPRGDPRGGGTIMGGGSTPSKSSGPPSKVAQPPPASGAQCSAPLCRQMSQANCERLGGPNCANMAASLPSCPGFPASPIGPLTKAQQAQLAPEKVRAACYSNMLLRCQQGEAGGTGGFCVRKGGEPSCEVRAQRSC